jgi:hypothetical protein
MVAISSRISGFRRGRPSGRRDRQRQNRRNPGDASQHGLRPDQEEVAFPAPVEAADDEPEEPVPSPEGRPALGAECDLELLAEEQVLDEEALAAAESASKGGQEEAEEFDHPSAGWPTGCGRARRIAGLRFSWQPSGRSGDEQRGSRD